VQGPDVAEVAATDTLDALTRRGFALLPRAVDEAAVEEALRRLHLDIRHGGLPAERIAEWDAATCWFPHLRWSPEILALLEHLPAELRRGTPCEPQILVALPEDGDRAIFPHLDEPPPWAAGRRYRVIVGVALSTSRMRNGALIVWPFDADGSEIVELERGDAVAMHPLLRHTGGLNLGGTPRYAVYFRFLDDAGDAADDGDRGRDALPPRAST
jgi:ectoine hydroxylase-related dioxygenase (phytanoyl-CoA dioxygenase family)